MKKLNIFLVVMTGLMTLTFSNANAWYAVSKSGFGLFGYANVLEKHWNYHVAGVQVCAAELTCNGGGFNSCKWVTPLRDCEINTRVVHQNPPPPFEFQDFPDNSELFQVCEMVDNNIQNGQTSGSIIYLNQKLVTYNTNPEGLIYIQVYSQSEAETLGIWPL